MNSLEKLQSLSPASLSLLNENFANRSRIVNTTRIMSIEEDSPSVESAESALQHESEKNEGLCLECHEPMPQLCASAQDQSFIQNWKILSSAITGHSYPVDAEEAGSRQRKFSISSAFLPVGHSPALTPLRSYDISVSHGSLTPPPLGVQERLLPSSFTLSNSCKSAGKIGGAKRRKPFGFQKEIIKQKDCWAREEGLLALIQVIEERETHPRRKSISNSKNCRVPKSCGNSLCTAIRSENKSGDGWQKRKIGNKYIWYCENCTAAYAHKQYCQFCYQIYRDTSPENNLLDGLDWIQCESCKRWAHIYCICDHSAVAIEELRNPNFLYFCDLCKMNKSKCFHKTPK